MARRPRIVVPRYPHHVVQRGNRKMDVFFCDEDRLLYIDLLKNACELHGVGIWAYCLMTNHAHFIAVPEETDSLARCFADAHVRYTRRINKRNDWKGHLWQARFGSSVLDERYLLAAVRYVEQNPVRAGIVTDPGEYRWSSAGWHLGTRPSDPLVTGDGILRNLVNDWAKYLQESDKKKTIDAIRKEVRGNRPVGEDPFIKDLEERFQCDLSRKPPGRPKKIEKIGDSH